MALYEIIRDHQYSIALSEKIKWKQSPLENISINHAKAGPFIEPQSTRMVQETTEWK